MKFTAEEYYRAAVERMRQARTIHNSGENYALAMYVSGLAVECILRAFRWRKDRSFEGRHDLEDLLKSSELLTISDERSVKRGTSDDDKRESSKELRAAVSEVVALWHNNLRFASETSLRAFLRAKGRLHGVKGDVLKKNSADLLNSAQVIIDRGVVLWLSKKK